MEKILILGSSGNLGTSLINIIEKEKRDKWHYIAFDHSNFDITNKEDLKNLSGIIGEYKPKALINCIAIIGSDFCERNPLTTIEVNSIGVRNLEKITKEKKVRLIQPSSHSVFYGDKKGFYTEEDCPNPRGVYSISKFCAESFALENENNYVIRFPTMFGPRRNNSKGFVDKMIDKLKNNQEIQVPLDKIDSPTYTIDASRRVIKMVEEDLVGGIYHIANKGSCSYYSFIQSLKEVIGSKSKINPCLERDFPFEIHKPLNTSLKSIKLPELREWDLALKEYVKDYI